ncbi:MAG: hypothetical protein L0Z62_19310 [Gemmataceae bacterium]|nr:hypothetical protein [Gemmataceae bacterium]
MFDELQAWWQNVTPETLVLLREGSVGLAALVGGYFLGSLVARALRTRNFDAVLRLPGSSPPGPEASHGFTPTLVAGLLVRLTVWGAAAGWLARQHGRVELASTLGLILNRAWALAAVLVAALALASLLASRVIDCLKGGSESSTSRNGPGASQRGLAGAVGAGVYGLVVLLALLIAADFFDWPLTRSSALALWQLSQHLLTAGAALLIGCLGARWARDLVPLEGSASPEQRAGQYTGLGIVATTTILAVTVLLSSSSVVFGLTALAILGLALWLVRGHLPDVAAGLQLRAHQVHEVWWDGVPWDVVKVGLLTTEVGRAGEFSQVQNRLVLEARMHGAPAEAGRR